ncbi:MAG: hypothetical protein HUU34_10780 [Saprospiraceae bacterium]|nr:hypothetical protein [Saprospiraceae bacterium]
MDHFRLDRTAFQIKSHKDAAKQRAYWMKKTPMERLAAAWYLTCTAYNLDIKNPPRMDRSVFAIKKRPG